MFDDDAVTFIVGNDFVLAAKGEVSHAELIQSSYNASMEERPDFKRRGIIFHGDIDSMTDSIEGANEKVHDVGELQGRFWVNKKIISFWEPREIVKSKYNLVKMMSIHLDIDFSEYAVEYTGEHYGKGGTKAGERHNKNLGARYISKDDDSIKTPEEKHFERMLLKKKNLREFLLQNKDKIKKLLRESNTSGLIDGGTREIAPFASFRGYQHFLHDKVNANKGYNIDYNWLLHPKYVYANEDTGKENGSFSVLEEDKIKNVLKTYNDIHKLYLEFISHTQEDGIAKDGSEYGIKSGEIGKATHKKYHDGTPKIKDQEKLPKPGQPGHGGLHKSDKLPPSNKVKMKDTPFSKLIKP